jgi:hypothetical protein
VQAIPGGSSRRTRSRTPPTSDSVHPSPPFFLDRRHQEAVRIEVAHDQLGDLALARREVGHVDLPEQMVVEVRLARQRVLERRRLARFPFAAGEAVVLPRLAEIGLERDLLQRLAIGQLLGFRLLGRRLDSFGRRGALLLLRDLLLDLLEDRVCLELLRHDGLELHARHLQQLDRLLQRRRHDQPLRKLEGEFLLERHGDGQSWNPSPR